MKNITTLSILVILLTLVHSFAQSDDEWSNQLVFNRVFENGQKISDVKFDSNDINVFGKISSLNDSNQKTLQLVKFDDDTKKMKIYLNGIIENLNIKRLFQRDSTVFIYKMEYTWYAKTLKNSIPEKATVVETQILDRLGNQVITVVQVMFQKSGKELYCWSDEILSESNGNQDIVLPQVLKVKRVSLSMDDLKGVDNPNEYISYALWTKDAFYRYAKNNVKDSILFSELIDSSKVKYTSTVIYKDTRDQKRLYINNYSSDNYYSYISTIDIVPFPSLSNDPIIPEGSAIIWEKTNTMNDYFNMKNKVNFIGANGFSKIELKNMKKIIEVLEQIIRKIN